MTTEEATGRLNLYDDPSPLPKTDKYQHSSLKVLERKQEVLMFVSLLRKHLKSRTKQHPKTAMRIWK